VVAVGVIRKERSRKEGNLYWIFWGAEVQIAVKTAATLKFLDFGLEFGSWIFPGQKWLNRTETCSPFAADLLVGGLAHQKETGGEVMKGRDVTIHTGAQEYAAESCEKSNPLNVQPLPPRTQL